MLEQIILIIDGGTYLILSSRSSFPDIDFW